MEYYDGSKRMRVRRSSFPKALVLIESLKIKFLNGKADALQFEGRDQHIYLSAVDQLNHPSSALQLNFCSKQKNAGQLGESCSQFRATRKTQAPALTGDG